MYIPWPLHEPAAAGLPRRWMSRAVSSTTEAALKQHGQWNTYNSHLFTISLLCYISSSPSVAIPQWSTGSEHTHTKPSYLLTSPAAPSKSSPHPYYSSRPLILFSMYSRPLTSFTLLVLENELSGYTINTLSICILSRITGICYMDHPFVDHICPLPPRLYLQPPLTPRPSFLHIMRPFITLASSFSSNAVSIGVNNVGRAGAGGEYHNAFSFHLLT